MWWVITFAFPAEKVLSDEVKRKQYDLGFDPNRGSTGKQQHYRAGATSIDPEELFRRIFGEFADFGHFDSFFDDRPEVWHVFKCQFELFPWAQSSASLLWTAFSFWWSSRFWRQWWVPIKTWVWTSRTPAWGVTEVAASRAPRCLCATTVTALAWWVFCPLCCRKSLPFMKPVSRYGWPVCGAPCRSPSAPVHIWCAAPVDAAVAGSRS